MTDAAGAILVATWFAAIGWWFRGLYESRKERKAMPYTYRWKCSQGCDAWLDIKGSDPGATAVMIERVEAAHRCNEPLI